MHLFSRRSRRRLVASDGEQSRGQPGKVSRTLVPPGRHSPAFSSRRVALTDLLHPLASPLSSPGRAWFLWGDSVIWDARGARLRSGPCFLAGGGYPRETAGRIVPLGLHALLLPSGGWNRGFMGPCNPAKPRERRTGPALGKPQGSSSSQFQDVVQTPTWISACS